MAILFAFAGALAFVVMPLAVLWALRELGGSWLSYSWRSIVALDVLYASCWLLLTHALDFNERQKRRELAREAPRAAPESRFLRGGKERMQ